MRTALVALALVACAPASETTSSSQTTTPETVASKTSRPTLATLQTHDRKVTILGGTKDGELRVLLRDLEGTVLADGITVDELSRTDPMLGAMITNAVAQNGGSTYLDATLYLDRH